MNNPNDNPDIGAELTIMAEAIMGAQEITNAYFRKPDLKTWEKSKGHTVSEADIAVNNYLESVLKTARPNYGWLSEESPLHKGLRSGPRNFIVDPIDGTSAFIAGRADWCIALALEEFGEIIAAIIAVPVHNQVFRVGKGLGAWRGANQIFCAPKHNQDTRIIANLRDFSALRIPNKVRIKNHPFALILRIMAVAEGQIDAMIAGGLKADWDIAAGALMVSEAGGRVSTLLGEPLHFNHVQPFQHHVLVASNASYDSLLLPHTNAIN